MDLSIGVTRSKLGKLLSTEKNCWKFSKIIYVVSCKLHFKTPDISALNSRMFLRIYLQKMNFYEIMNKNKFEKSPYYPCANIIEIIQNYIKILPTKIL